MGKAGKVADGAKRTRGKSVTVSASYFPPEKGMSKAAQKIWVMVVASMPEGYFSDTDRPQLRGYCESWVRYVKAGGELEKSGASEVYVDDKGVMRRNPWLDIQKDCLAIINSASTKLRLSKSTQISPKIAGRDRYNAGQAAGDKSDPLTDLMFQ